MTDRAVPDEFDALLRGALGDIAQAARPDPALADMLVANARAGRQVVVRLDTRRRATRWLLPLVAAASIVALAVGLAVAARVSRDHGAAPLHRHGPTVTRPPAPTPSNVGPVTPTPTTVSSGPTGPAALPHFRAENVTFAPDGRHGWALGDARCPSGSRTDCPALLSTADGGSSWRPLSVPSGLVSSFDSASCGNNGSVSGTCVDNVAFANRLDGYLWSLHEIYWTTDGGRTWSRYVDPAHSWDGASQLVVAAGSVVRLAPIGECSSGCAGTLEAAPIGTVDWRVVHPTRLSVGLFSSRLAVRGSDVYLFAGGGYANAGAGVFRSSDGGATWTRVAARPCGPAPSPEQDPFDGRGSTVADDGALVVECNGPRYIGVRVAPPGSSVFSPSRQFPAGIIVIEAAQSAERFLVADVSHGIGSLPHERTIFFATTDAGRTWHAVATLPSRADSVSFSSGTTGSVVSADGSALYRTTDGGLTWREQGFTK